MTVDSIRNTYQYGMRALGAIAGTYHTNTREGYIHWRKTGIKFWEVDVALTEDRKYVMIGHFLDKETMKRMEIMELPERLTYNWYMQQKLFPRSTKGLTPLSLEDIVEMGIENKDSVFMLDMYPFSLGESYQKTYDFLTYLSEFIEGNNELYDRIIVEAYNTDMIRAIHQNNKIKNIQLSVSHFMENEKMDDIDSFVRFAKNNGVNVISYEWRYARKNIEKLQILKDCDFVFISRSVTNLFENKRKKKYGVNVALLDYYVRRPYDFIELMRLFISRFQKKHG